MSSSVAENDIKDVCQGSFFASCSQFPLVQENGRIPTEQFLNAARGIVKFVEFLGTVFKPVRSDIDFNITKLNTIYEKDPIVFEFVDAILSEEKKSEDDQIKLGTDALLWLTRAIEYIKVFLSLFLLDYSTDQKSEDLTKYFANAYEVTLMRYHGWFVQKIFSLCLRAAPGRKGLLLLLARPSDPQIKASDKFDIEEKEIFEGIQNYLYSLETSLDAVKRIYSFNEINFNQL